MEILTYVLEGSLAHRDSLGTTRTLGPGEVQRMTAGTGLTHSEFNPSSTLPVHFYQIWILPERDGLPPSYDQRLFPESERLNQLRSIASPNGAEGALSIAQNAYVYLATLEPGRSVAHSLEPGRHAWLQVLRGAVDLNANALQTGDGGALSDETTLSITALTANTEIMLFDLE